MKEPASSLFTLCHAGTCINTTRAAITLEVETMMLHSKRMKEVPEGPMLPAVPHQVPAQQQCRTCGKAAAVVLELYVDQTTIHITDLQL